MDVKAYELDELVNMVFSSGKIEDSKDSGGDSGPQGKKYCSGKRDTLAGMGPLRKDVQASAYALPVFSYIERRWI